jgi:transposase InsO family protein
MRDAARADSSNLRRHVMAAPRIGRPTAGTVSECWSMDFVADALFDGRRIRALTVVDNFTRESMAIEVGQGITDWKKNWGTLNLTTVATYEWGEVGVHATRISAD